MSIVVTGATGHLGRHVVEQLLEKVPADQITAVVRDAEKAADFAARGVKIAVADYNTPETFDGVFAPATRCCSSPATSSTRAASAAQGRHRRRQGRRCRAARVHQRPRHPVRRAGRRPPRHRGGDPGVRRAVRAAAQRLVQRELHREPRPVLEHNAVVAAAGEGRVSSASRADYAAAAVAVLTGEGHENQTYELGGDEAWSFAEYAAELSRQTGKEIAYNAVSAEVFTGILTGAGLPEPFAAILAGVDASIEQGELVVATGDLSRL
jgi:NAD(P)H dehydrogenase (quinone)